MLSAKLEVVSPAAKPLPATGRRLPSHPANELPNMAKRAGSAKPLVDPYQYQPAERSAHPEAFKVTTSNYSHAVEGAERRGVLERMKKVRSIEDLGECIERNRRASCCGKEGCIPGENMSKSSERIK
jgi:hypothetical protein